MRDFRAFITHLRSLDYAPETVLDVGVAWGTPELYEGFPTAYFILIEALPCFEGDLERILKRVRGESHLVGVGDKEGQVDVAVNLTPQALAGANVLEAPKNGEVTFTVPIRTIDVIVGSSPIENGALLKLDVQGADLRALHGATGTLRKCDTVIVEASLTNRKNLVRDIIDFLFEQGFQLYEIFAPLNRPYDNAQGQVDLAFVRKGHALLAYEGWN